jgi:protein-tyrosine phosphatase
MADQRAFVDIHCHLLPAIDDGASSWDESLAMARMAVDDGTRTIIATPHQLGAFGHNRGEQVRACVQECQRRLRAHQIDVQVLAGADVRVEEGLVPLLRSGDVLTLGDRGRHVLLELPHELYFPLQPLLRQLEAVDIQGILSHPERNQGLLAQPRRIEQLVEAGCLTQVTAGSLMGTFGKASKKLSEEMLSAGLVHFIATDAHGIRSRRPLMDRAFRRAAEIIGVEAAATLCCSNPAAVAEGRPVAPGRQQVGRSRFAGWCWSRMAG